MGAITLPNFRTTADVRMNTKLKDGGVYIEWSSLTEVKAWIWSDTQKALAGRVEVSVDTGDATVLKCLYASTKPQYPGVNRLIVQGRYNGSLKTYDKPVFNFVPRTAEATGSITISDPGVYVEIEVTDTTSSILDNTIAAALAAADRAEAAAEAAEHMVDIHTGPEGKSAYEVAVEEGYTGTEEEWLASLNGPVGETPDISIGTVTTVEPGTPAAASMGGTPEAPVLNLSIPKGAVGATPNFTVGTVTTGQPGTPVVVTITGTPEAPVLNVTIPQGMQGNTGSSVEYPYELVNNLTTDDATKGLSAAQGKVLDGKVSQLGAKVTVSPTKDVIPSSIIGLRVGNSISTTAGEILYYVPVTIGQTVKFKFSFSSGYGRYGQTTSLPASGVSVVDYHALASTTTEKAITATVNGYVVISFVESAVNSISYETEKDDIGGKVYGLIINSSFVDLDVLGTLNGKDISSLFHIGGIQITTSGWTYEENNKRVSTNEGVTLPLRKGDVISLSSYSNARFYLGWKRENGTYGANGWITSDYTVTEDGDYVILLANVTEVVQTSVNDLCDLLTITRETVSERIDELDVSQIVSDLSIVQLDVVGELDGDNIASFFHIGGVQITTSGWTYISDNKRVCTNQGITIPLRKGDIISLSSYTDARFYLGWKRKNGTYGVNSWVTSDYTVTEDGDYIILLANVTEVVQTNVTDLCGLLKITRKPLSERVDEMRGGYVGNIFAGNPYYYHYAANGFILDGNGRNAIASESLEDVALAARFGFRFIEANIHKTSDGKFVCIHGSSGALGPEVMSVDEDVITTADLRNTLISSVTLSFIKTNARYASYYQKWQTTIPTLEEFCQCCKENNIGIFAGTNDADAIAICQKYLGTEVILYGATVDKRSVFDGYMFTWNNVSTYDIDTLLGVADSYGRPYMLGVGPSLLTALKNNDDLDTLIAKVHESGYLIGIAGVYQTEEESRECFRAGMDFSGVGWEVNPFDVANSIFDLDCNLPSTTGTIANGIASLGVGETISCGASFPMVGKVQLSIRFNGELSIDFGSKGDSGRTHIVSSGDEDIVITDHLFIKSPALLITADSATTITNLVYKIQNS